MVVIGNAVTASHLVADPGYSQLDIRTEQVTTKQLSEFTLKQKSKEDFNALGKVNDIKREYGIGTSSLVRIYNASGHTLSFRRQGPDWYGHMYKYPADSEILNGQWSVFLHVKDFLKPNGSESCVVYTIQEDVDIFMGWMVPLHQSIWIPTVHVEMNASGHWNEKSWDYMYLKINKSDSHSSGTYQGRTAAFKSTASIGNDFSPQVNYVVAVA